MTDQEGTPLQDITETTRLPGNPAPVVVSHVQVDHIVLLLIPDAQTVTNSTIILECADSQNQPQNIPQFTCQTQPIGTRACPSQG